MHDDPRRVAWRNQRGYAAVRGIEFKFSFEEWVDWWETQLGSNWMRKRGNRRYKFVMARLGDKGCYEIGNVKCITQRENRLEQVFSPEVRARMNLNLTGWPKGKKHAAATIRRIRLAKLGSKHTAATKAKMSAAQLARWQRSGVRAKMSLSARRGWRKRRQRLL